MSIRKCIGKGNVKIIPMMEKEAFLTHLTKLLPLANGDTTKLKFKSSASGGIDVSAGGPHYISVGLWFEPVMYNSCYEKVDKEWEGAVATVDGSTSFGVQVVQTANDDAWEKYIGKMFENVDMFAVAKDNSITMHFENVRFGGSVRVLKADGEIWLCLMRCGNEYQIPLSTPRANAVKRLLQKKALANIIRTTAETERERLKLVSLESVF